MSPCVLTGVMLVNLLLFCLCVSTAAVFDSRFDVHWELWKKTHGKTYENQVSLSLFYLYEHFFFMTRNCGKKCCASAGMKSICKIYSQPEPYI